MYIRPYRDLARDEGGATMIEYAFIVLFVSIALGVGGGALGDMLSSVSKRVTQKVQIGDKPCTPRCSQ
jgi:Flp pilus assembly pilin Flp